MGWWSLGPEDEQPAELRHTQSSRHTYGGASRVPGSSRGCKDERNTRSSTRSSEKSKKRKSSPKKKRLRVVGGPKNEEPTLFASIGRMVNSNSNRRPASEVSSVGTAKYPGRDGILVKASNNANEAQRRANEMANAMAWLTEPTPTIARDQEHTGTDLFGDADNWWESNTTQTEDIPDLMALLMLGQTSNDDNDVVTNETEKYTMNGKELSAEKKAREFEGALQWLHKNRNKYDDEEEIDFTPETFQMVDALFEKWMPKTIPSLEWERYDPREEPREAERLTKDLKKSLALILSGDAYDNDHPNIPKIRQLKNLFADWKLKEDDEIKELENALGWWKLNANTYDPSTATEEDTDMFLLLKKIFGLKKGDTWEKRGKEMENILRLWSTHQNDSVEDLEEDALEKLKQMKDSFLQIKREELSANNMKYMAKEMDEVLSWYLDKGYKIEDLSKVKNASVSKFKKVQGLLSLWGRNLEPSVDRLKEIVKFMVVLGRNNSSPDELKRYNGGETGAEFQNLQETMMNWRLKGTKADDIATIKGDALSRDIADVLDWWVKNREAFDFNTASQEDVYMAQMSKSLLNTWMQCDRENAFSFQDLKLVVNQIKEFLALYRDTFEKPEILQELTISWDSVKEGLPEKILTDIEFAISWWRANNMDGDELKNPTISHDTKKVEKLILMIGQCLGIRNQDADSTKVSWIHNGVLQDTSDDFESHKVTNSKSEFSFLAPVKLSEQEKITKAISSALDWLRTNDAVLDLDDDMSIALSIATFKKIDALMPKTKYSDTFTAMDSALDWLGLQTDVDNATVSSLKKMDDVHTQSDALDSIKQGGFQSVLDWLRKRQIEKASSNVGDELTSHDGADYTGSGPRMSKSEEEKQAQQMASALDWFCNNNVTEEASIGSGLDSLSSGLGSVDTFKKLGVANEPSTSLSVFDWSRSQTTNMEDKPDYDVNDGDNIDDSFISATGRPKLDEIKKAEEMSDALASLRKNGSEFVEKDSTNLSFNAFKLDDFVPVFQETRDTDREDFLNWIRGGQKHFGDAAITNFKPLNAPLPSREGQTQEASREYRNLEKTLAKKKGSKPEDWALEVEGSLDWLRSQEETQMVATAPGIDFSKVGPVPICVQSSDEKSESDDGESECDDPSRNFSCVDQLLPKNKGQKTQNPKDLKVERDGPLDWTRIKDVEPSNDIPPGRLNELDSFPLSPPLALDSDNNMNWQLESNSSQYLERHYDSPTIPVDGTKKTQQTFLRERLEVLCPEGICLPLMCHQGDSADDLRDDIVQPSRPGNISLIPRDDPASEVNHSDMDWSRNTTELFLEVPYDPFVFENPDLLSSIPASQEDSQQSASNDLDWIRYPRTKTQFEQQKLVFQRPSSVHLTACAGPIMPQKTPEADWGRHPNNLIPAVADDDVSFDRPDSLNSLPKSPYSDGQPNSDEVDWACNSLTLNVKDEIDSPFLRPGGILSIPRDREPVNDPEVRWVRNNPEDKFEEVLHFERPPPLNRVSGSKVPYEDDTEGDTEGDTASSVVPDFTPAEEKYAFDLPDNLRSIPRSYKLKDAESAEFGWSKSKGKLGARVPEEDVVFYPPGVYEIPHDNDLKTDDDRSVAQSWACNPNDVPSNTISREENVFDWPGNIRSLPRGGKKHEAGFATQTWNRNPAWKKHGSQNGENAFDHPGDLRTIPCICPFNSSIHENSWDRNSSTMHLSSILGQENVFDKPGDIQSIPCGSKPQEGFTELSWERNPAWQNQAIWDKESIFDHSDSLRSIPRIGRVNDKDHSTMTWGRNLASKELGYDEKDNIFDRPGSLRSIPRDSRLSSFNNTEFIWARQASFESIVEFSKEAENDQSEDLKAIPRDGCPNETHEWELLGPKPNWMVTIDDASWTKKDPYYNLSGVGPFDRPENTLVTLPTTTSLDDAQPDPDFLLPDDLTEFTEIVEEKPQPVTGVPCAAWTMLALGAAAGGAMTSRSAPQAAAVSSQFANNQIVSTTTDTFYPGAGSLPSCSTDANCWIVMDGLSPILPPDVLGLFDVPGTCQSKARDWLRTGKDILQFKAERIRQRYAMSVFFCEMDGGDWIQGDSWLSDLHECDWYNKIGLDPCNRDEQVEMLRVTDNGLTGTLPVEMFILSNLFEFTLANNLVSGTLPQLFDQFKELDTLVIPFNQLEGSFPHQIWEYPDMVYLDVAYNGFTGTIPSDIDAKMPNLQVTFLENNKLSGPIPESLGNLKQLRRLHLDDNKFTGTIPETFGLPARMNELLLHDNLLTGQVPKQLGNLKQLQLLTLHYNSFDEQTIDENICNLIYREQLELATVDKVAINCGCCSPGEESFV